MVRYKEYVQKMLAENKKLFDEFKIIHDKYAEDDKYQDDLNRIGEKIQEIIKEYENRVCANTERGMYTHYSGNLAEKFQNEVRILFPMIDYIGIKTNTKKPESFSQNSFQLKKLL